MARAWQRLGTDVANTVFDLLRRFSETQEAYLTSYEGEADYTTFDNANDKLDDVYYTINEAFLHDVEASL